MRIDRGPVARIGEEGRVVLPPGIASQYGLAPGAEVYVDRTRSGLAFYPSLGHLKKVYIEPTNRCNLECRTCIRHSWTEALGHMDDETFDHVMEGVRAFDDPPVVFFGGFGEPLAHPRIVEMVSEAKSVGARVELITNGMLLDARKAEGLIGAGLDTLWVTPSLRAGDVSGRRGSSSVRETDGPTSFLTHSLVCWYIYQ